MEIRLDSIIIIASCTEDYSRYVHTLRQFRHRNRIRQFKYLVKYTESTLDATKMRTSTLHTCVFRVVAVADSNAIVGAVQQRGLGSSAYHVVQGDRTNTRTKL